jgi:hypothetical protein
MVGGRLGVMGWMGGQHRSMEECARYVEIGGAGRMVITRLNEE